MSKNNQVLAKNVTLIPQIIKEPIKVKTITKK